MRSERDVSVRNAEDRENIISITTDSLAIMHVQAVILSARQLNMMHRMWQSATILRLR